MKKRCEWAIKHDHEKIYHDNEWGVPLHDDQLLFEFLILEGAQAGLSWSTILKKRDSYRIAYHNFDPHIVAQFTEEKIQDLLQDAQAFLKVVEEFGTFDTYIWNFVDGTPIVNSWKTKDEVPAKTPLSDAISKDLKKRGFKFVGSTICYAFMQATGMVNDHTRDCFRYSEV